MHLTLRRESDVPLYRQVVEQIRALIHAGALPPSSRLPTIRELARAAGLTRLTVQSAYAELQAQGLVEGIVGRGTFVVACPTQPRGPLAASAANGSILARAPAPWNARGLLAELASLAEHEGLISFARAIPAPETYPLREFKRALVAAAAGPDALGYGPIQGDPLLREQVSRLLLDRGIAAPPEHVLITAGAQQGLAVILQALTRPGDVVLIEEPAYPGMIELAAQRGQRLIGVERDAEGPVPSALVAACDAARDTHRPCLFYLVPTYHNPTGSSVSEARRTELLRIAATYDLLLIEDDIYGFLALDGPAPAPLMAGDRTDRVLCVTSFSKALMPGIRLGALVAPPALLPQLASARHALDLMSPPLLQRALAEYLRRGAFALHLAAAQPLYRERRDALLEALGRHLPAGAWTRPAGGLSLWLTLPDDVDERDFFVAAVEHGVGFARGEAFYPQLHTGGHLRLSFGALPPAQIEEGVQRLAAALNALRRRRLDAAARAVWKATPLV
jgi:DNA-binding transcriptional MocR family regulator